MTTRFQPITLRLHAQASQYRARPPLAHAPTGDPGLAVEMGGHLLEELSDAARETGEHVASFEDVVSCQLFAIQE